MSYADLREFVRDLEDRGALRRVPVPVDPVLEVTEICQRTLRRGGPALLFERPAGSSLRMIGNLFGSVERVARAVGGDGLASLRALGEHLAELREPRLPRLAQWRERLPLLRGIWHARPRLRSGAPCDENRVEGSEVDLARLPIQHCWPEDAGKLITFGLVITRGPERARQNIGIYRQQVIGRNKLIMRWLHHRGGAGDFAAWCRAHPGERFPVAAAIGADPATLLAAVAPIPDTVSEFEFAGLLRGARSEVVWDRSRTLYIPASAEIVLEGHIDPQETALEGPFGDHTGYYNAQERFPVFTVERMRLRNDALYHASYMGRSPHDEPSVLAQALNEVFVPLLRQQFPEVVDFYLPPEACSYRIAVVSIKKGYPGHARRMMFGLWSSLRQFTYTKWVIVVDDDIDARDWKDVMWAVATRMDPARDVLIAERTPVDYLDFASPEPSLGGKIGFDATGKWPGETARAWGRPIRMREDIVRRVDELWSRLNIP